MLFYSCSHCWVLAVLFRPFHQQIVKVVWSTLSTLGMIDMHLSNVNQYVIGWGQALHASCNITFSTTPSITYQPLYLFTFDGFIIWVLGTVNRNLSVFLTNRVPRVGRVCPYHVCRHANQWCTILHTQANKSLNENGESPSNGFCWEIHIQWIDFFRCSPSTLKWLHYYRPWSREDNTFGSVRLFVCLFVGISSQGALKMVGRSKWLLFWQAAPSRSIMLLYSQTWLIRPPLVPGLFLGILKTAG